MTHAGSANLISLGLSPQFSGQDPSIRRWLAGSLAIHALIIFFLTTLRFSPTLEQPFHSYEVALINPSELNAPPAKSKTRTKTRPKARVKAKANRPKARPVAPPKPKTAPVPPPETKAQPPEPKFDPLPTQTASERLSDSFAGAVKSVIVPKELSTPSLPTPSTQTPTPTEAETPSALEDIKLPTTAPKLSRAQRLEPRPQVSIPESPPQPNPSRPQDSTREPAQTPKAASSSVRQETAKALQSLKAPPEAPTLKPIQPFRRSNRKDTPKPRTEKLSDSFRKSIQSVKVPKSRTKAVAKNTPERLKATRSSTPAPSTPEAPQLAQITPSQKKPKIPKVKQERLADSLKQVLGTVKIPKLRQVPAIDTPQQSITEPNRQATSKARPVTPDSSRTQSLKSEIDQQLAKLTIPDVAPIESLKERLQVQIEAAPEPASSGGSSASRNSQGQNRYLALIEAKIEQHWVAPRVSIAQKHPQVILRFRVLPSGEVTNLGVKQGSGNGYYDAAAKRAVKAASPLPPFPKDLKSSYLDLLYKFRIGESTS